MKIANFDDLTINDRPVAPIGIVFRDTPSTPRPRTLRAAISADGGEWSASTGVAAALEGRSFIGIKGEDAYVGVAARRLEELTRQAPLFG